MSHMCSNRWRGQSSGCTWCLKSTPHVCLATCGQALSWCRIMMLRRRRKCPMWGTTISLQYLWTVNVLCTVMRSVLPFLQIPPTKPSNNILNLKTFSFPTPYYSLTIRKVQIKPRFICENVIVPLSVYPHVMCPCQIPMYIYMPGLSLAWYPVANGLCRYPCSRHYAESSYILTNNHIT